MEGYQSNYHKAARLQTPYHNNKTMNCVVCVTNSTHRKYQTSLHTYNLRNLIQSKINHKQLLSPKAAYSGNPTILCSANHELHNPHRRINPQVTLRMTFRITTTIINNQTIKRH
eukprot:gene2820-1805_t